jgi:hypothetical protein
LQFEQIIQSGVSTINAEGLSQGVYTVRVSEGGRSVRNERLVVLR